jgi:hypothetical protein
MRRLPATGRQSVTNKVTAPDGRPPLLTDEQIAPILGFSAAYLRKDRIGPRRIPFLKIGSMVRYDLEAVRNAIGKLAA